MNPEAQSLPANTTRLDAGEGGQILARIREALRARSDEPDNGRARPQVIRIADARSVLPAVGADFEQNLTLFQKNALELKADFVLHGDASQVSTTLARLRAAESWQRAASHHGVLSDAACQPLGLPVLFTDTPFDKHELAKCDAGITECDALVAQTGTVVVTSRSAGGRALSVLPPHHVVLARREQLVPGLPDAFELLKRKYGQNYPSMVSLVTGPSRTADIERILVLGAHGPKKLTILCW